MTARAKAAEVPTISGSPEIPGGPALTIEAGYGLILGSVQAKRAFRTMADSDSGVMADSIPAA